MKKLILFCLFVTSFCGANAQVEQNDSIKTKKEKKEFVDPIYGTIIRPRDSWIQDTTKTPGDYLIQSAKLKITGIGLGLTTSTLFAVGAFDNMPLSEQTGIAIISGVVSLALYVSGEINVIKAGKLMNKERISVSAASEGIGLAINF
jgi:hypothetical protein